MTDESLHESPGDESVDPSYVDAVGDLADGAMIDLSAALASTPDRDDALRQLRRLESVLSGHRRVAGDAPSPPLKAAAQPVLFTWGSLEVREKLGEGTFGEVYRAWDPGVGREVALKLRKPGTSSKDARRWLDEARRLARVRHPNVLVVHGADEHDGRAGIWTELLFGRTLEERLKRDGPMGAREAALIGTDLCSALAAVHAAGLIHGDIKTTNVMREGTSLAESPPDLATTPGSRFEAGRIVLMDFGTAVERPAVSGDAAIRLYATPLTAAPEVLDGKSASVASDLYSLGVVLYRLVTERYPIEAATLDELRAAAKSGALTPLRNLRPELPASFVQVIERATAADPAQRFATAAEMERALAGTLGAIAAPVRPPARHGARARVAWIAGLVIVTAATIWGVGRLRREPAEQTPWVTNTDAPFECRLAETFNGLTESGSFGFVLDLADVNRDGHQDCLIGAPHALGGRAYVFLGGPNADDLPDVTLSGGEDADQFGRYICANGDVNGDGTNDFVVGESRGTSGRGRVHVYFGAEPFDATPDLLLVGESNYDHFGVRIAVLDFNADGFDDILVGAYFNRGMSGRAYLYFGGAKLDALADLVFAGENRGDALSGAVGEGDLNHDGYEDLVLTEYGNDAAGVDAGRVNVYFGGPAPDAIADLRVDGVSAGDNFGNAVCMTGDYDGDGFVDLVVGAYRSDAKGYESGAVYGFRGGPRMDTRSDFSVFGQTAGDRFGTCVAVCEVTGDAFGDVIVSAISGSTGGNDAGRVYIFPGGHTVSAIPSVVLTGRAGGDNFGIDFVTTHNIGDGRPGLLVGAHNNDFTFPYAGQAYLYVFEPKRAGRP